MAIPIKQQQAQIQAPTSQVGRAVDASRAVEPILKDSLRLTEAVGVFAQQLKINADKSKVNEAIRVYFDEMTAAKDVFGQTQEQQTIDAVGNLNKAQDEALDKFNKSTFGVNPSILNEAKQKISGYNLTLREHNSMHLYKETQKVELANFKMSQDADYEDFALAVDNFISAGGSEGSLSNNIAANLDKKLQGILNNAMDFYLSKGMPADYAFTQSKKDIDSNLSHTIDRVAQKYGNETALRVLDTSFVQNRMSEDARLKEYRQRESGMLQHMVFETDNRLYNKDGSVNKSKIKELTPHLFDEERDVIISNAEKASDSGFDEKDVPSLFEYTRDFESFARNQLYDAGITDKEMIALDATLYGKEAKALTKEQEKIINKIGLARLIEMSNSFSRFENDNPQTIAGTNKRLYVDETVKNKYITLANKGAEMLIRKYAAEDYSAIEDRGFFGKIFKSGDPTVKDYIALNMVRNMKEYGVDLKPAKNLSDKEYVKRVDLARKAIQDMFFLSESGLSNMASGYTSNFNQLKDKKIRDKEVYNDMFWNDVNRFAYVAIENANKNESLVRFSTDNFTAYQNRINDILANKQGNLRVDFDPYDIPVSYMALNRQMSNRIGLLAAPTINGRSFIPNLIPNPLNLNLNRIEDIKNG